MQIYVSMKFWITLLLVSTAVFSAHGQIDKSDLLGEWICENNDSLYYTSKYVTFYSDSSFKDKSNQCDFIEWIVKPEKFMFVNTNKCVEDGLTRINTTLLKNEINLKRVGRKIIIELTRGAEVYDKFKVIDLKEERVDNNSRNIKILKLKRF
jgi:hypothetical protein